MERYHKLITGGMALGISILLYLLTFSVKDLASVSVGPGFVPRIVAILLFALGAVLLIQGYFDLQKAVTAAPSGNGAKNRHAVLKSFILLCAYVSLLSYLGFIIMSCVYLFLQMLVLAPADRKRPLLFGAVSIITSVSAYYLFVGFFRIMIPAGILG